MATESMMAEGRPGKTRRRGRRAPSLFVAGCLLPAMVLYITFMLWPAIQVFRMSLYHWSGFAGVPTYAGLENFRNLLQDDRFVQTFQNTVLLAVITTIVTMSGALVTAAMLTNPKVPARALFRFVLYLPCVLSIVVVAAVFSAIYDQDNGLLNGTLQALGLSGARRVWLGDSNIVLYSVALSMVWQALGYYMVLYMAGMAGIPTEIYEAAEMDGATPVRTFFTITIPLVWNTVRPSLTFFVTSSINLSFVLVHAMTSGGPNGASDVLLNYMFNQANANASYGYAMAVGVVIFVFSFGLAAILNRVTKRDVVQF